MKISPTHIIINRGEPWAFVFWGAVGLLICTCVAILNIPKDFKGGIYPQIIEMEQDIRSDNDKLRSEVEDKTEILRTMVNQRGLYGPSSPSR